MGQSKTDLLLNPHSPSSIAAAADKMPSPIRGGGSTVASSNEAPASTFVNSQHGPPGLITHAFWLNLLGTINSLKNESEEMTIQTKRLLKRQREQIEAFSSAQTSFTNYQQAMFQTCLDFIRTHFLSIPQDYVVEGAVDKSGNGVGIGVATGSMASPARPDKNAVSAAHTAALCVGRPDLTNEALKAYSQAVLRLKSKGTSDWPISSVTPKQYPCEGIVSPLPVPSRLLTAGAVDASDSFDATCLPSTSNPGSRQNGKSGASSAAFSSVNALLSANPQSPESTQLTQGSPILQNLLGCSSWKKTLELLNVARMHHQEDQLRGAAGRLQSPVVPNGPSNRVKLMGSSQYSPSKPSSAAITASVSGRVVGSPASGIVDGSVSAAERSAYLERLVQSIFQQTRQPVLKPTSTSPPVLAIQGIGNNGAQPTLRPPPIGQLQVFQGKIGDKIRKMAMIESLKHPSLLGRDDHVFIDVFCEKQGENVKRQTERCSSNYCWLRIELIVSSSHQMSGERLEAVSPLIYDHFTERLSTESEQDHLMGVRKGVNWLRERCMGLVKSDENDPYQASEAFSARRLWSSGLSGLNVLSCPENGSRDSRSDSSVPARFASLRFIQLSCSENRASPEDSQSLAPSAGRSLDEVVKKEAWMGNRWFNINKGLNFMWKAEVALMDDFAPPKRTSFQRSLKQTPYQSAQSEALCWLLRTCLAQDIKCFRYKSYRTEFLASFSQGLTKSEGLMTPPRSPAVSTRDNRSRARRSMVPSSKGNNKGGRAGESGASSEDDSSNSVGSERSSSTEDDSPRSEEEDQCASRDRPALRPRRQCESSAKKAPSSNLRHSSGASAASAGSGKRRPPPESRKGSDSCSSTKRRKKALGEVV